MLLVQFITAADAPVIMHWRLRSQAGTLSVILGILLGGVHWNCITQHSQPFHDWFVWPCQNLPMTVDSVKVCLRLVHDKPRIQVQVTKKLKVPFHAGATGDNADRPSGCWTGLVESRCTDISMMSPTKAHVSWKCRPTTGDGYPQISFGKA